MSPRCATTAPHDADAETSLISVILAAPDVALPTIRRFGLQPAEFYDERKGAVLRAATELADAGVTPDSVTVRRKIEENGQTASPSILAGWLSPPGLMPLATNAAEYCRLVRQDARRRDEIRKHREAIEALASGAVPILDGSAMDGTEAALDWPSPLSERAYHGLAGEIVRAIDPTTEADPVALLLQLLVYFGNAAAHMDGSGAYRWIEDTKHGTNEFVCLVGATSKARKGTAEKRVRTLFKNADEIWTQRIRGGASSGEGLIWAVRDPTVKDGKVEEAGEPDKRLLLVEPEFASVLRRMEREGSSLSPILREAWDRMPLYTLVSERSRPASKATTNHVSMIGHITRAELTRYLTRTEMANGLANRFMFVLVRRSKCLPRGGSVPTMNTLVSELHSAIEHARACGELDFDEDAYRMWDSVYESLSEPRPGLAGEIVARAEAHVPRLALTYALLDRDSAIRPAHLLAALSVWTYCEESVSCMFAVELGDPDADAVLAKIRESESGRTREELRDAFDRHWPADRRERALKTLLEHGAISQTQEATKGRPATRFRALNGSRTHSNRYAECAVSALSAVSPDLTSNQTATPPTDSARKVSELDGSPDLPRTYRALTAQQLERDLSSDSSLSALTARYRARDRATDELSNPESTPKSPASRCACGALDWELVKDKWRCHKCGESA